MNRWPDIINAEARRVPNAPGFGHKLIGAWGFPKREPRTAEERRAALEVTQRFIADRCTQ